MAEPVYRTVIGAAISIIHGMGWKVAVSGEEHIPKQGAAIIATNHIGYLDFVFAGYAARKRGRLVRFLAKQEVYSKKAVGWLMRKMKHIPVDRSAGVGSYAAAIQALRDGEMIGMFPEATISPSFIPRPGKNGAVRMAQETEAALIPAAVWGTQRILTKWRPKNFKRGIAISVVIGEPIALSPEDDAIERTQELMTRIGELLERAQAEYPQKPAGESDGWWLPAHLGGTAPTYEEAEERLRQAKSRGVKEQQPEG